LIIEGWVNESSEPGSGNGQFMGYFMGENASDYCETGIVTAATYQGDLYFRIVVGGVTKLNNYSQDGLSDNTWYWLKTIWNNTMTIEVYDKLNGTLLKAATNASARCNCTRIGVGGVRRSYADTSWARKTHNPEPVYSIGNEESNSLANEEGGRSAILEGIGISLGGFSYDTYADRQIYARNASDSQKQGKFDEVVVLGNQTWAFNYIPPTDNTNPQTWMFNITPVLYVWEYGNKTYEEIINSVSALINSTKL
jgi:hypothetical protein